MLDEALRRASRGTNVVAGRVDARRRPVTEELLRRLTGGDQVCSPTIEEMLASEPSVVLVDDLGAIEPDGRRRWQLVEILREAGVDVVATTTVQHVASLRDVIEDILGVSPDGEVPDSVLATADQIEIVDSTPEAIRRRVAHGNVFPDSDVPPERTEIFDSDAFARLRLVMFEWFTTTLESGARADRSLDERIIVALDGPIGAGESFERHEPVLRRAARLAASGRASLIAVRLRQPGDPSGAGSPVTDPAKAAVEAFGGRYVVLEGGDPAATLVSFARGERATQVVIGAGSNRSDRLRVKRMTSRIAEESSSFDLHVVPRPTDRRSDRSRESGPILPPGVSRGRTVLALVLGLSLLIALTAVLADNRGALSVATSLVLCLLVVVVSAAIGGFVPGIALAVASPLVVNWFLIPPYHTFRINDGDNILELAAFVTVAAIVASYVSVAARRTTEARRAWREASTLFALAESGSFDPVERILELLRTSFDLDGAAVVRRMGGTAEVMVSSGRVGPGTTESFVASLAPDTDVVVTGGPLDADTHRILHVFVSQLSRALEQRRLHEIAMEAETLSRADDLRTAILRAVSHDLRSPLASIKASVSSLRQGDVVWSREMTDQFLESIESESDRLTSIVTNLLDLSRLEAGVLQPNLRPMSLEEVLPVVVGGTGVRDDRLRLEIPPGMEDVVSDPSLVDRILANLVENALKWSGDSVVVVRLHRSGNYVQVHVVDHGPGIPQAAKQRVREPFHRVDDKIQGGGLGLGLAIADRFAESIGGRLELRDTPGGGLTAVLFLPISRGVVE